MGAIVCRSPSDWRLIATRVERIGVQKFWRYGAADRWAVSLDNRTYHGWFEIPSDRVVKWARFFR